MKTLWRQTRLDLYYGLDSTDFVTFPHKNSTEVSYKITNPCKRCVQGIQTRASTIICCYKTEFDVIMKKHGVNNYLDTLFESPEKIRTKLNY